MQREPKSFPVPGGIDADVPRHQGAGGIDDSGGSAVSRMVGPRQVLDILRSISIDLRELDLGSSVTRLPSLTAVAFLRDFVATNKPVVLTSSEAKIWPAVSLWSNPEYLMQKAGNARVTVAVTPDGRADCPRWCNSMHMGTAVPCFALPYEYETTLSTFLHLLKCANEDKNQSNTLVPYMQYQNSSLTVQLPVLIGDVPLDIPWATEAFGSAPEAVNIWIGGSRSVTSWHRDHYENIYVVITGSKTFRMRPPADAYAMKLRKFSVARWQRPPNDSQSDPPTSLSLSILDHESGEESGGEIVVWSSIMPSKNDLDDDREVQEAYEVTGMHRVPPPLEVTVQAGEMLYLPSGWWHEVHHEENYVVAVNYWYDMKFDLKYAYAKGIEALAVAIGLNEAID